MVVALSSDPGVDAVLHALADPTRRDIVRKVAVAEHSVSALARCYPMSFAAVQKHVAVLERAGVVAKRRCGRQQLVSARLDGLRTARQALDQLEALWRSRLEQMDHILDEPGDHR